MAYAFQTPDKLCFILDLMNGGDLHYHLSQHGVFSDREVQFYAAEIILGLEHMHSRFVVYRDLKPANVSNDLPSPLFAYIGQSITIRTYPFSFSIIMFVLIDPFG